MSATQQSDLERDASRWRKLEALIQAAENSGMIEYDEINVAAEMLFGRGERKRMAVTVNFTTVRDLPADLGSVLDQLMQE